jgi:hypothetical protein
MLTLERLKQVLHYDPVSGIFTWIVSLNARGPVGARAGTYHARKYRAIGIDGVKYYEHRLAWFYVTGEWKLVDHINRVRDDNRFENLRPATKSQNAAHSRLYKNNKSGVKGITRNGSGWAANIKYGGQNFYLGTFRTKEEAHEAYMTKAREFHGDFSHDGSE